jgi:hypothetical protein
VSVLGERAEAFDLRVLRFELRRVASTKSGEAFGFELLAGRELRGAVFGLGALDRRNHALLRHLVIHRRAAVRHCGVGLEARDGGLLREARAVELSGETRELRLGHRDIAIGFERLQLGVGIRQLHEHGVCGDLRTRLDEDLVDPRGDRRRGPAEVDGHERAGATDFECERALLHGADPELAARHRRRTVGEPVNDERDEARDEDRTDDENDAARSWLRAGARHVHQAPFAVAAFGAREIGHHSLLSATVGSTFVARRAGTHVARSAVAATAIATPISSTGWLICSP